MNPIEMTQHQIWFDKPAKQIEEALPIGNGEIGGLFFGDGRILFNEGAESILGHLEFTFNRQRKKSKKRYLLLREALCVEEYEGIICKSFISYPDKVMVLHFEYDPQIKCDIQVTMVTEPRLTLQMASVKKRGSLELYVTYFMSDSHTRDQGPRMTKFKIEKYLKQQMSHVKKFSYTQLVERHIKDVGQLYQACVLKLPGNHHSFLPTDKRRKAFIDEKTDASLVALYFNYGRYLLIQGTRSQPQAIAHENLSIIFEPYAMTGLSRCQDAYFSQENYDRDHLRYILHVKERYTYTHDEIFLKEHYPKIKRAILGILDKAIKEVHEQKYMNTVTRFYEEVLHILGLANGEDYELYRGLEKMVEALNDYPYHVDEKIAFLELLDENMPLTGKRCAYIIHQLVMFNEMALAKQYLYLLIGEFTCPNLITRAIAEMLVHSHGNKIKLLPGILDVVASGKFHGIRTQGGHSVSLNWQNGSIESAQLTAGSTAHLMIQFKEHVRHLQVLQGETYELESLFIDEGLCLKMNNMR